jgi:hypothetical protein
MKAQSIGPHGSTELVSGRSGFGASGVPCDHRLRFAIGNNLFHLPIVAEPGMSAVHERRIYSALRYYAADRGCFCVDQQVM